MMAKSKRAGPLVAAAVLITVTIATLVAQVVQQRRVPLDEDWRRAAETLLERASEDDAYRVVPAWESRARVPMGDLTYVPASDVTWFDTAPYPRVWILAETRRAKRAMEQMPEGWSLVESEAFGSVTLLETKAPDPPNTLWDVLSDLGKAKVERRYKDRTETCLQFTKDTWPSWHCKRRDPFLYVGESMQLVTNDPHRCLWAMPIDQGGELSITWEDVPLGEHLVGRYGQTFDAIRSNRGTPVQFRVRINGKQVLERTSTIHEEGFKPFYIDTKGSSGEKGTVEFSVQADVQLDRMFCFVARTVAEK